MQLSQFLPTSMMHSVKQQKRLAKLLASMFFASSTSQLLQRSHMV